MGLIKFFYEIFKVPKKKDREEEDRVSIERLVDSRIDRRSLYNEYVTKEDIQELKQKVLKYKY